MAATIKAEELYSYQSDAAGIRTLLGCAADGSGTPSIANVVGYWNGNGIFQTIFTPSEGAANIRAVYSRDYMYFCDGIRADLLKWNITTGLSPWGLASAVSAIQLGAPTAGAVTLLSGRIYYVVFEDGSSINFSDLNPPSPITGPLTNQQQPLIDIPVSGASNASTKTILATADGGDTNTLYFLASIPNSQTTYTDDTPETTLLLADVYQYTDSNGTPHGVVGNQPPPNGSFPIKHNGRLWMLSGQSLFFSKSLDELVTSTGFIAGRYEEAWPIGNVIDISELAEQGAGLLSAQATMFIGTESGIHSFLGDSPTNFTEPSILFENTGLMTQNVWQIVFLENTPVGAMWVTPDFRCLGSDYNTYDNVGIPIQNVLNTINQVAINNCFAVSVQFGAYNFYALFICTGNNIVPDTACIYEMHLKKWFVWQMADTFLSGIFYTSLFGITRWIVCDSTGTIRSFAPNFTMDRFGDANQTGITSTMQSVWLSMGDSATRKTLNEVELGTNIGSELEVTVAGATQQQFFNAPGHILVTDATPILDAFHNNKVMLAGTIAKDRHYQYTISTTSTPTSSVDDVILSDLKFEVVPLNRL